MGLSKFKEMIIKSLVLIIRSISFVEYGRECGGKRRRYGSHIKIDRFG